MEFLKHAALKKGLLNLCNDAWVLMCLLLWLEELPLDSLELKYRARQGSECQ